MSDRVRVEITDGLAELRMVRSEGRNGIDMAMVRGLDESLAAVEDDPGMRSLLVTAEGPAFTVGGDLGHLREHAARLPAELDAMIGIYHDVLGRLSRLPVPVTVAARGAVAGGGLGLLWCADVVVAADDLRIATGFVHLALSGDGGSSWHLPRLVGLRRAQELILGGRVLEASEALDWGLVTRVVPGDELEERAHEQARAFADAPTVALAEMKRLLLDSSTREYPAQLAAERAAIVRCADTEDAQEGLTAFAARRRPSFRGR